MNTIQNRDNEQKGLVFAVLVLTVGLIWFFFTIKLISASGINIALQLWPLALIAIGVDLSIRKQSPHIALYLVLAIAAFVILAAFIAPRLGIGVLETKTETYTERIADAESATINLHPSVGEVNVQALASEDTLFNAAATYLGELDYTVQGDSQRQIDFGQHELSTTTWLGTDKELIWNIGLSPNIPLSLTINTGVGTANLDLTGLHLTSFNLIAGVGQVTLMLPKQEMPYQVNISAGVGDLDLSLPADADVGITVSNGVGDVIMDMPDDAAMSVRVASGLGSVHVPSWLIATESGTDEQVWQSANFESASRRITVYVESGLGDLTLR
jgi:predicted membrane protein